LYLILPSLTRFFCWQSVECLAGVPRSDLKEAIRTCRECSPTFLYSSDLRSKTMPVCQFRSTYKEYSGVRLGYACGSYSLGLTDSRIFCDDSVKVHGSWITTKGSLYPKDDPLIVAIIGSSFPGCRPVWLWRLVRFESNRKLWGEVQWSTVVWNANHIGSCQ